MKCEMGRGKQSWTAQIKLCNETHPAQMLLPQWFGGLYRKLVMAALTWDKLLQSTVYVPQAYVVA